MSDSAIPADLFADQVLPYGRLLHATALRLTGNPADAEERCRKRLRARLRAEQPPLRPGQRPSRHDEEENS